MRVRAYLLISVALLGVALWYTVKRRATHLEAASSINAPWRERMVDGLVQRPAGSTIPHASNGHLVSFVRNIGSQGQNRILLFPTETGEERRLPFWIAGASAVRLEAAEATTTGHVIVAGSYTTVSAGTQLLAGFIRAPTSSDMIGRIHLVSNFVAELDGAGNTVSLTDLGAYTPERLCVAPDNTFWTFGQEWASELSGRSTGSYDHLRHYDQAGAVLGSYVPSSHLRSRTLQNYHFVPLVGTQAFLACSDTSAALYAAKPPMTFLWAEVDASTGAVEERIVLNPRGLVPTGLALVAPRTAYASFGVRPKLGATPTRGTWFAAPAGVYKLDADAPQATWSPLTQGSDEHGISLLLGRDGSSLVHLSGTKPPSSLQPVFWTTP